MALSKTHAGFTLPIIVWSAVRYPLDTLYGVVNLAAIIFFGILLDGDHISPKRIKRVMGVEDEAKKIRVKEWPNLFVRFFIKSVKAVLGSGKKEGGKGPVPGWINYLHTWQAATVILVFSFLFWTFLPAGAYAVHIAVDAASQGQERFNGEPLPRLLHRFIPRWLVYKDKLPL